MMLRTRLPVVIPMPQPYGDVGAFEAQIVPHRYLLCGCGRRVWWGETPEGAPLYVCIPCKLVADVRRFL